MMKRGTKVECTSATGNVIQGVFVKPQPVPFWGKPGIDLWYIVKLADQDGIISDKALSIHHSQVRNVDNRRAHR